MIYKNYTEAYEAAKKMRLQNSGNGIMVKIEKSSYGGFQVKLIPTELIIQA